MIMNNIYINNNDKNLKPAFGSEGGWVLDSVSSQADIKMLSLL